MVKSYKYRIYPNKQQRELIKKTFGCCRYVYNYFLDIRIKAYQEHNKTLSYYETSKLLTELKNQEGMEWLKEVDAISLQSSLQDAYYTLPKRPEHTQGYAAWRVSLSSSRKTED